MDNEIDRDGQVCQALLKKQTARMTPIYDLTGDPRTVAASLAHQHQISTGR
jgi:hypothetical protein